MLLNSSCLHQILACKNACFPNFCQSNARPASPWNPIAGGGCELSQILLIGSAIGPHSTRFEFAIGPNTLNEHETSVPLLHYFKIGTALNGSKSEDLALMLVECCGQEHGPITDSCTFDGTSF